jgi:hypothetical protein
MWVFTRYGFYSVAALPKKKKQKDRVLVRARLRRHLEELQKRFPEELGKLELVTNPRRDYRFRIVVPKAVWATCLFELSMEQDWSNFKSEAERFERVNHMPSAYVDALHDIWTVMFKVQNRVLGDSDDLPFLKTIKQLPPPKTDLDSLIDDIERKYGVTKVGKSYGDNNTTSDGLQGTLADETVSG